MKVYLRDLKDGPFEIVEEVEFKHDFVMDDRIKMVKKIDAHAKGTKFTDTILLDVKLSSILRLDCDRCSDEIDYVINDSFNILMTKNESLSEYNHKDFDVVLEIKEDDIEIDISHNIFEGINVSLPMRLAPEENKNGECSYCSKSIDFGSTQPEHHRKEFEKLKNLFK